MIVLVSALALLSAGCDRNDEISADQQTGAVAEGTPSNEAIDTTENREAGAPFPGANSFTESQAVSRLAELGYTNPTELRQGEDGIWRGKAMKDGQTIDVAVDFQGNVVTPQASADAPQTNRTP
jgi:hypothetical protein